jgi:hypothetical protein
VGNKVRLDAAAFRGPFPLAFRAAWWQAQQAVNVRSKGRGVMGAEGLSGGGGSPAWP